MHNTKVIILGGGVAGIAAAKQLTEHGIYDFLIIEGESRVGGRMKETELNGTVIELGANWLANINSSENPIWPLAQDIKLQGLINILYSLLSRIDRI